MTLSSRDRRVLLLGAAVLAAICALRFAVMPWLDNWADARRQIVADKGQLDDLTRTTRRVLGQRARLAERYGPAVNDPPADLETARIGLFKAAQEVLKTAGFKATSYDPQPHRTLREIPGVRIVPLQVRGKCKLQQLAKCLAGLRKAETLVIVDRLSITNDRKKPGNLDVTIVLLTLAGQGKAGS